MSEYELDVLRAIANHLKDISDNLKAINERLAEIKAVLEGKS